MFCLSRAPRAADLSEWALEDYMERKFRRVFVKQLSRSSSLCRNCFLLSIRLLRSYMLPLRVNFSQEFAKWSLRFGHTIASICLVSRPHWGILGLVNFQTFSVLHILFPSAFELSLHLPTWNSSCRHIIQFPSSLVWRPWECVSNPFLGRSLIKSSFQNWREFSEKLAIEIQSSARNPKDIRRSYSSSNS